MPVLAGAQTATVPDLMRATLEDLLTMEVTSASRREQRVMDTAASVFVITNEAIRRSGLNEVPELLRLAPGVQVARIDASTWAISIRGFNTQWSNKLLVLVDGRTVYNRLFSGVYWDSVNLPIESIDRIEVIRGPGASVWGANAVNGVINILTRPAAETPGLMMRGQSSTLGDGEITVQYGGRLAGADYRVHVQGFDRGASRQLNGADSFDDWRGVQAGVRFDWRDDREDLTVQADASRVEAGWQSDVPSGFVAPDGGWPLQTARNDAVAGHVLARWTRRQVAGGTLHLQGFADLQHRHGTLQRYTTTTIDGGAEYTATLDGIHDIVAGAGYRVVRDDTDSSFYLSLDPARASVRTTHAFVQNESRLASDRLHVTLGTKLEHDTLSTWALQPTARVLWALTPRQRIWSAVSRAVRSPSRGEVAIQLNFETFMTPEGLPIVVAVVGNPDFLAEKVTSVEAGYRIDLGHLSVDASAFRSHHDNLQSFAPQPVRFETSPVPHLVQPLRFANGLRADTTGLEVSSRWAPNARWHVDGGYSYVRVTPRAATTPLTPETAAYDGYAPRHQWQVRPGLSAGALDVDVSVSHTGALVTLGVPAYTRADAHAAWRLAPRWSVGVFGQNLFAADHAEFSGPDVFTVPGRDPRRSGLTLTWHTR